MSYKRTTKTIKTNQFEHIAKGCKTDHQKVQFFDYYKEAFFPDSNPASMSVKDNVPKDLDDAFYVYANMKKMNEKELKNLKNLDWKNYPKNLKIFLFDYCIFNDID